MSPDRRRLLARGSLSTRIAVPAGFFALVSVGLLSWVLVRAQREQALAEAMLGGEAVAETIYLATGHEMRVNERDALRIMVRSVGRQEGIEAIRIYNKDGRISFSSVDGEVGRTVPRTSPACASCHSGPVPPQDLSEQDRSRIYENGHGRQLLATIRVISNQEGCQGGGCHEPPSTQSVLGVLEVTSSLEPAHARVAASSRKAFLYSLLAVGIITGALILMISWSVRRPLDTMVAATRRVASGDPTLPVPRGAAREIGILASSFNELVESLADSRARVEEWAGTLEERVAEKARQLQEAQFQVVQAEKLSSVGLVAAGIAHELNSPLMAILTFTHLVKSSLPEDAPAQDDLAMIERETNRCAAIIRQLLDFARKQTQDAVTEPRRVSDAVRGALDLLKVEIQNADVEVRLSVPDELPRVEANGVQLMQVFVNLVLNAVHAMPGGGTLTIEADVAARADYADSGLPPHAGTRLVRTAVRDTGHGIPAESLSKVFDPFFTTKPVGKGSGLGLSVSLGLVRGYRGTILVESDGATGATFTVLLPVPEEAPGG